MKSSNRDSLDVLLFIGSILALGFSILAAGSMAIVAGVNDFLRLLDNAQAAWTVSVIFGAMGLLTVPSLYLSFRSINGQPALVSHSLSPILFLVGAGFPFALGLGMLSQQFDILSLLLEPVAHVLAAVTPMLFMSIYVLRRLPQIPWRRIWGQFAAGLWVSPFIALIVEMISAIPLVILLFAYVWTEVDPRELLEPLTSPSPMNETYLETQIQTALNQPLLIIATILFVTVLVPLLEECIKTIALWPMLRRGLTPLHAFVGGAIAGGAYGLFEAFFLAQPGEEWTSLMVARAGATFMHMVTTGIVCMGLALALKTKKWKNALRYYSYSVLLHGLWNLAAIGVGLGYLFQETGSSISSGINLTAIMISSGVILSLLAAAAVFGLHAFPKYLLKQQTQVSQEASAGVS